MIPARFLAVSRARPEATAISAPGGTWTYGALERASRQLAIRLLDGPDGVVALHARRSGELVVAMLGCLRAGRPFAVLDAEYPVARLDRMREVLAAAVELDTAALDLAGDATDERIDREGSAIAYVMFTSGTTGVPKCIATSHAPLVHFVEWYERTFAVTAASRVSMLSGLGHDPILRDVFVPLSTGGELHIPAQATVFDPAALYGWLGDARITHAHLTPQLARIACAGRRDRAPLALEVICSGGDALRVPAARALLEIAPRARVVNFYGTTETPQAMAFHVFDPAVDTEAVPIGRGIADVELRLEDGEVVVETPYLSAGLHGVYRTGDLGHRRADGAFVLDGRRDDQVKIRGFRVELGDATAQLLRCPGVEEAVVLAERLPDGEQRLVAYLVGAGDSAAVRDAMTVAAPPYLVPGRFVWVPALPLLPNGKIDRRALEAIEAPVAVAAPADPMEGAIIADWRALLAQPRIGADQTFVELGGDSLSFIEASVQLEKRLGALPENWERRPIRELARAKQAQRRRGTSVDSSVLLRAISIVGVVIGHYELPNLAGTVIALFVVSGLSFGKYVAPPIVTHGRLAPLARLIVKIVVPTILYSIAVNLFFRLPIWPGVFLVNNLVSADSHVSGIGFWYIDVLVQCFVLLGVLLALRPVRRRLADDPFPWLIGATLVLDALAALAPLVVDTSALADRVPHHFLGALVLGWAAVHATTRARKWIVVATTLATFAQHALESAYYLWFPFVATLFVLAIPRVTLPRALGRLVTVIASASLFIYLTDHQVGWAFEKAHLSSHYLLMVLTAIAVGVAFHQVWQLLGRAVRRTNRVVLDG